MLFILSYRHYIQYLWAIYKDGFFFLSIAVLQVVLKFKLAIFGGLPLSVCAVLNNYSTLSNILA